MIFGALALCTGCGKNGADKEFAFDCSGYETVDFETISLPEGIKAFAVQPDGTLLCSSTDEKMYSFHANGAKQAELPAASFYGNLCVDGDAVYAYDDRQAAIVELTDDGEALGDDVGVIWNAASFHTIRNMVAVNGKIYVLAIPFTEENAEKMFSFGALEFEDYGENVYCIDAESGEYHTLDLEHIIAEYRSEDGRLFFYGWQEDKYFLYEYDVEKEKIAQKLSFDSMGNLFNMTVEGGYLFGISSFEGLLGIDLETGEKTVWIPGLFAMYGNDLQFYRGNLFVNNPVEKEIQQVLAVGTKGEIIEIAGASDGAGTNGNAGGTAGGEEDGIKEADNSSTPEPTDWPKRTEKIGVSMYYNPKFLTSEIKKISGMKTKTISQPLDLEALITELMAGSPDVDIYVFAYAWPLTQRIKELGLYVPLNDSEIIAGHLEKCFDYVQDAAKNENGDIWMLPLDEYCQATWYIPENMQKFDVEAEELGMLDSYIAVLERLHNTTGNYRYYNNANTFFSECDSIYNVNYNDFAAKEINFDTELYRHMAEIFWPGWDRYGSAEANHPLFFKVI